MKTPEQKNLPFEPTDRNEPEEERGDTVPTEEDERFRLAKKHGVGAEDAALMEKERKAKKKERDESIAESRRKIHRILEGDA